MAAQNNLISKVGFARLSGPAGVRSEIHYITASSICKGRIGVRIALGRLMAKSAFRPGSQHPADVIYRPVVRCVMLSGWRMARRLRASQHPGADGRAMTW